MATPFDGLEVEARLRPAAQRYEFDLERALSAVVAVEAGVPDDALTAEALGTYRVGNGVVIGTSGLVLTIGYLVTEAEDIRLTLADGRRVMAHALGVDPVTGFGLLQPLEPLDLPALPLGDVARTRAGDRVVIAGAGGTTHAAAGHVLTRMPFAGYWEYFLDDAIMAEPAHPHWSGAALIGADGALLGIGSLLLHRQVRGGAAALNLFVPVDLLPPILEDLSSGRAPFPPRPWLGALAADTGGKVIVTGVSPRSPAARAELRARDVIAALDGQPVKELADYYARLWASGPAGVTVTLTLQREGDTFDVRIRTADRAQLLRRPRAH